MTDEKISTEATKEAALYVIDKMRPEIERGNFRAIMLYVKYLYNLVRLAAIIEERNEVSFGHITIDGKYRGTNDEAE